MRTLILSVTILLFAGSATAALRQDDERCFLDPSLVPAEGAKAADFVPRG